MCSFSSFIFSDLPCTLPCSVSLSRSSALFLSPLSCAILHSHMPAHCLTFSQVWSVSFMCSLLCAITQCLIRLSLHTLFLSLAPLLSLVCMISLVLTRFLTYAPEFSFSFLLLCTVSPVSFILSLF